MCLYNFFANKKTFIHSVRGQIFFLKKLILLFSKNALNWSKVLVKAFIYIQKKYV